MVFASLNISVRSWYSPPIFPQTAHLSDKFDIDTTRRARGGGSKFTDARIKQRFLKFQDFFGGVGTREVNAVKLCSLQRGGGVIDLGNLDEFFFV